MMPFPLKGSYTTLTMDSWADVDRLMVVAGFSFTRLCRDAGVPYKRTYSTYNRTMIYGKAQIPAGDWRAIQQIVGGDAGHS